MNNYLCLMYDIENYVYIPSSNNKQKESYNLITHSLKEFSDMSL